MISRVAALSLSGPPSSPASVLPTTGWVVPRRIRAVGPPVLVPHMRLRKPTAKDASRCAAVR